MDNASKIGITECAAILGRTVSSVAHKSQGLNQKDKRWWTQEEVAFLLQNHGKASQASIARHLGRTVSAIEHKFKKEGLARANHYPEDAFCIDCGKKLSNKYLAYKRCEACSRKHRVGEHAVNWAGGVSSLHRFAMSRLRPWREAILERDNSECHVCGSNHMPEVHHVRPYAKIRDYVMSVHPELGVKSAKDKTALAVLIAEEHCIDDGVTLCYACHKRIHAEKRGELLETPNAKGEDNQQPSQSNVIDLVGWKVQRLMGEEITTNKPDTSAPEPDLTGSRYSLNCMGTCRSAE